MVSESNAYHVVAGAPDHAEAVLAQHSHTFRWAARLIPKRARHDLAVLYAFCRFVDDLVDEATLDSVMHQDVLGLRTDLRRGSSDVGPVQAFLVMAQRTGMPMTYAHELADGVVSDIGSVQVASLDDLLRYCYRVASTVGLMICHLLQVQAPEARAFAIDLGLAMQLTNIARDVVEDFHQDRIYLPAHMVAPVRLAPAILHADPEARHEVYQAILRLLEVASRYYRSADRGMRYLPWWARWGILTASRSYEGIGTVIRQRPATYWSTRAVTTTGYKCHATLGAAVTLCCNPLYWKHAASTAHDTRLHSALSGFPGVA